MLPEPSVERQSLQASHEQNAVSGTRMRVTLRMCYPYADWFLVDQGCRFADATPRF